MLLKSILHKEYAKVRKPLWAALLFNLVLSGYVWLETRALFRQEHAEMVWYQVMQLDRLYFEPLQFAPLASGVLLALAQFLPEMRNQRIRLSLHLPVNPAALMLSHYAAGGLALGLCLAIQALSLVCITMLWFPVEMLSMALATWLPWACAGMAGYLGVILTLLEPSLLRRLGNLTLAAATAGLFFWTEDLGAYNRVMILLGALPPLMFLAALHPAYRYRYRRAD